MRKRFRTRKLAVEPAEDGLAEPSELDTLTRELLHGLTVMPIGQDRHRDNRVREIWREAQQQGR